MSLSLSSVMDDEEIVKIKHTELVLCSLPPSSCSSSGHSSALFPPLECQKKLWLLGLSLGRTSREMMDGPLQAGIGRISGGKWQGGVFNSGV